jgi:phospholipase/carboxylesterase
MNYALKHIVRKPKIKTDNPAILLMLHGYGSNEQDLFSFANELPDELLIISVQAPLSIGFGAYAWYTIHFEAGNGKFSDIPEAITARDLIVQFIDELQEEYHFDSKKSFLMGFSQGTILSYAIALNHPEKIKNIIALSGYINEELLLNTESDSYKNLDFFCSHGSVDDIIPVDWARKTPKYLESKNISYFYEEYPIGHGVSPQNFKDLLNWISERL